MQYNHQNRDGIMSANFQGFPFCALALALFTFTVAHGQQVLIAPPAVPEELRAPDSTGDTNQVDSSSGAVSSSSSAGLSSKNPFQYGPVILHPHLGYSFSYGTGLHSLPGQSSASAINSVSTGIGLDLGRHWNVSYSAAAAFYSDQKFKTSVNHNLSLNGHTTYEDWAFNLTQSVGLSSDPQVETAQQTDQQVYSTTLATSYQINSDWSAELTAGQDLRYSQGTSQVIANSVGDTSDWSLSGALNYQVGPGVSVGLGAAFGYDKVGIGPDMTHEDLNLQFTWQFARKFSLSLNGGTQIRQFLGSGQASLISPTFGAGLNYHPLQFTTLSLSASRGISPSLFRNEVTETTSVNLSLNQRFLKHFYFGANGGYGVSAFKDSTPGGAPFSGREDTRSFISLSLSTGFLKHGTASLSYSKSHNSSNAAGFSYNSDQVGFSLAYSY